MRESALRLHDFQILVDPAADFQAALIGGVKAQAVHFVTVAIPADKGADAQLVYAGKAEGQAYSLRGGKRRSGSRREAAGADLDGGDRDVGSTAGIDFRLRNHGDTH